MSKERWKPVPLAAYSQSYAISSHGRVKSLQRTITYQAGDRCKPYDRTIRSRILRPSHFGQVTLSVGDIRKTVRVAALLAAAFPPQRR